jgi:hypothetical protein
MAVVVIIVLIVVIVMAARIAVARSNSNPKAKTAFPYRRTLKWNRSILVQSSIYQKRNPFQKLFHAEIKGEVFLGEAALAVEEAFAAEAVTELLALTGVTTGAELTAGAELMAGTALTTTAGMEESVQLPKPDWQPVLQ